MKIRTHQVIFALAMLCWGLLVLARALWRERINWETADPYGMIAVFLGLAIYLKLDDRQ